MDIARIRQAVEVVSEVTARVDKVVELVADEIYQFLDYAEEFWTAQPSPVADGPVEEDDISNAYKEYSRVNDPAERDKYIDYLTEAVGRGWIAPQRFDLMPTDSLSQWVEIVEAKKTLDKYSQT